MYQCSSVVQLDHGDWHPSYHHLPYRVFRRDGLLEWSAIDKVLTREMETAQKFQVKDVPTTVPSQKFAVDAGKTHEPIGITIWTRQSNEESQNQDTTHNRQLISTLVSPPAILQQLGSDNVVVVVKEYVSSSKHPFEDRKQYRKLFAYIDRPTYILAANPDRLIRRVDEVSKVFSNLSTLPVTMIE